VFTGSVSNGVSFGSNRHPVLSEIGDIDVDVCKAARIMIHAYDFDGDNLSFHVLGLPDFITFTDYGNGTCNLTFCSSCANVGVYTMEVIVSDGLLSDSEEFILTVD
jgi:hypothetical protein